MPIGNPGDLSPRAVRVLGEVDLIACEDTRRAGRVLAEHSIRTRAISYFEHNEERRTPELIELLGSGGDIAIITDAGTPAISDPGYRLVRAAVGAGIRVTAVPGPSAVAAALSIAGLPTDRFVFEGFPPNRGSGRRRFFERLALEPRTIVIYEAARRLAETLTEMAAAFGGGRPAAVMRELTKTHEETVRGTLAELAERFRAHTALGEVTLVVAGAPDSDRESPEDFDHGRACEVLCGAGMSLKDAAAAIAKITGGGRREIYQEALRRRGLNRE
jgi:16S rRNA (cytidine1402-2'-O)-methyltransferase